jgi:hypothetical protein
MSLVVIVGCGKTYRLRLEKTVEFMKYLQRLDQNLGAAPQGKLKELSIYIRPPKGLEEAKEVGLPSVAPGMYDLAASFFGAPPAASTPAKEGTPPPDPNAVLRLHVLARLKKPKAPPKKGEPPPPDTSARGEFIADVKNLLATDLGGAEGVNAKISTAKEKNNAYKRLIYDSTVNNDSIRVYFYNQKTPQGDYDVAVIWDIPAAMVKETSSPIALCLESFAVGGKALNSFARGYTDDTSPASGGGASDGGAGASQAF